jgi:flagellar assembly factor FliW
MKLLTDVPPSPPEPFANSFSLPDGLIGLPNYTSAEIVCSPEQVPFLWLHLRGPEGVINFIVIEPGGIIRGYEPELFAMDAAFLDISDPAEAMVLNIVTLEARHPVSARVNLVGPLVINRRTRIGRQLVIANYSAYDSNHPLVEAVDRAAVSA